MSLIKTSLLVYSVDVLESDIRDALILEAAEKHGLTDNGKLIKGVCGSVTYDGRRGSATAGYTVRLTRNVAASDQAQLPKPVMP